jgi:hypothetical protein
MIERAMKFRDISPILIKININTNMYMTTNNIEYIIYTTDIQLPTYDEEKQNCFDTEDLQKKSDTFLNQFGKMVDFNENDKLCVIDNIIAVQKFSPWRYFVRKYKNQNRNTLAIYLTTQINIYSNFLDNLIDLFIKNETEKKLYDISVNHYDFIQLALPKFISLRNKYNLKDNAIDLNKSLEIWTLKLAKFKRIYIELISNKRIK